MLSLTGRCGELELSAAIVGTCFENEVRGRVHADFFRTAVPIDAAVERVTRHSQLRFVDASIGSDTGVCRVQHSIVDDSSRVVKTFGSRGALGAVAATLSEVVADTEVEVVAGRVGVSGRGSNVVGVGSSFFGPGLDCSFLFTKQNSLSERSSIAADALVE